MSKNLYEYSSNKLRPKNRQVLSIKGKNTHLKVNDLKKRIKENYKFVGFLSNFENDVNSLSKILNLKYSKNIKRNQTRKSENNRILNNKFISLIKKNDSEDICPKSPDISNVPNFAESWEEDEEVNEEMNDIDI